MWGVLLRSLGHGLGKSYNLLDDENILRVQQVSGDTSRVAISARAKDHMLKILTDFFRKSHAALHCAGSVQILNACPSVGCIWAYA